MPSRRAAIGDRRQLFKIQDERPDPVFGERRAIRQDDRDRLADITQATRCNDRLKEPLGPGQRQQAQRDGRHRADLRRRDNGPDAGDSARRL